MIRPLLAALLLVVSAPAFAEELTEQQLHVQDQRLAAIADRIMAANASLCTRTMPITGLTLHSADQYSEGYARSLFGSGPVALALVLPGSPGERAGLRSGDALVRIGGQPLAALTAPAEGHIRESAFDLLARQPAGEPVSLIAQRGEEAITATFTAPPGCMVLVEILVGSGLIGRSDGHTIQISYPLAAMVDDDGLAVIFAHELAHVVLHHRARLEAAGVSKGLLGELGRNQQLNRQVEVEADRMSAHLLANAGYDPAIAPAFWRSATGRRAGGGLMRSTIYPSATARGDLIAGEVAQYLPFGTGPSWPGHLLELRDLPFAQ